MPPAGLKPTRILHHREAVMGTVVTFDLYLAGESAPPEVYVRLARATALLHRVDRLFSTYREDSPVSRLRRGEITLADCPGEVAEVLAACAALSKVSDGWFDPWSVPGGVDPSGYVKGWAAERALAALAGPGLRGAVVNAAGDIACFGAGRSGRPFRFGIVDPHARGRLAAVAEPPGAIATSGTSERGRHLIVPMTKVARAAVASASVTGPSLAVADALATALAVGGEERLSLLGRLPGYEAMLIGWDRQRSISPGFPLVAATGDAGNSDPPPRPSLAAGAPST